MSQKNLEIVKAMWEPMKGIDVAESDWDEALEHIEVGEHVIVVTRQWGTGRTSGAPVEIRVTHLMEFHDGLITRLDEFETLDEALEAAKERT